MAATDDQPNSSFLPDLCSTRAVLVVVVVAELMALVINLVATYYSDFSMGRLAITSLFVQWVGLTSAALVCQLRSRLNRLAPAWAAVAVVLVLGLFNMLRGGNPNLSQKLMRARVLLQLVALLIVMAVVYLAGQRP